jgi:hypothetical protein
VATVPRLLDMRISAVTASSVEFEGVPPPSDQSYQGFNPPGACVEALLGAAVEIVSGSPGGEWLVFSGQDLRGRIEQNQQFIALGTRFDYPPVSGDPLPPTGTDIVFAPVGPRPGAANNESNFRESDATFDGTSFTFALGSNDSPTTVRDVTALQGFADGVLVYQNRNVAGGLFYVSLTGTNALLQASPGNLGNQGAVAIYR